MATFAQYPSHSMASNDFTLYPYQDVWHQEQPYLPATSYAEQPYANATTFDSYNPQSAFAQPDQYVFDEQLVKHSINYSPAQSASHSFDPHNPPALSSTSDSGASIQSTISSTIGSPSSYPQQTNDWNHGQHMLPEVVSSEPMAHHVYSTSSFSLDSIPVMDKSCVGELATFSITSQPRQNMPSTQTFFSSPCQPNRAHRWAHNFPAISPSSRNARASRSDSGFMSALTSWPGLERAMESRKATPPLAQALPCDKSDVPAGPPAFSATPMTPFFSHSSDHFVSSFDYSCSSPTPRLLAFILPVSTASFHLREFRALAD